MRIKKLINTITVITVFYTGTFEQSLAQTNYKIQPNRLNTRWAELITPSNNLNQYPRPQLTRTNWQNLNGLWDYSISDKKTKNLENVQGKILVPYPIESALSGVKKGLQPDQLLWYKRTINIVPEKSKRIILHFGAVDWQASVYINGTQVGKHSGGYTSFSFDVTDVVKAGDNDLVVKVYDPTNQGIGPHGKQVLNPANIYYTPSSGIWQTVWLETVPADYIKGLKVTPDVDNGVVNLTISASSGPAAKLKAIVKVPGCTKCEILKQVQDDDRINLTIKVPNAKLWSPDDPYLYDLEVTLGRDKVKSYFGMRKIEVKKDGKGIDRIFLNGKYTYNLGTLDQGFWPDGLYTAPNDEALAFDIKAIKAMGFNTIRKHIKVEPARWYYWADKLGMMVWQDMVNPNQGLPQGAKSQFEKESAEIIEQLNNYPSITTWVLFNEKWGQYDQERLTKWVKKADPSRLINGHSGEYLYVDNKLRSPSPNAYIGADITDVHSYPNPMMPEKQQGKAWVCGEFGGIGVPVPSHQWDDLTGWGYVQASPNELDKKYDGMIKQLKELEAQGLSASIYTQPFDVEGEENGLMTYDREIIKIPINRLREIHSQLIDITKSEIYRNSFIAKNINLNDNDERYPEFQSEYNKGNRDSIFLRRLALVTIRKQDQDNAKEYVEAYLKSLKNIFTRENLTFLNSITRTSKDAGFNIYLNHREKVNQVMGINTAERKIRNIIGKEEIDPYLKDINQEPNWEVIKHNIIQKYGSIGEEKYNGTRMIRSWEKKQWASFGSFYSAYFSTALNRSEYHINNMSWAVFEHIADPMVIRTAIEVMKYEVSSFGINNPNTIDTYANLLYKAGDKAEAVKWQEKSVKLSKGQKEFVENLQKMKLGLKTW